MHTLEITAAGAAANGGARPDERSYHLTLGLRAAQAEWPISARRELSWPALVRLLTTHEVGQKDGPCFVPGWLTGARRRLDQVDSLSLLVLDSDKGHTLEELRERVAAHGLAAILYSTHSHSPQRPRFRLALPLADDWRADAYPDASAAATAWGRLYLAAGRLLGIEIDAACKDPSRLYYLPRRDADAPPAEVAVLDGRCLTLAELEAVATDAAGEARRQREVVESRRYEAVDTDGEVVDLVRWAAEHGSRFEVVTALEARRPDVIVKRNGPKATIRCPFEDAHSTPGGEGTLAVNASEIGTAGLNQRAKGFAVICLHHGCSGRDRLDYVARMLELGWLNAADLTDPAFLTDAGDSRMEIRLDAERINDAAREAARLLENEVFLRGPVPMVLVRVEEAGPDVVESPGDEESEPGVVIGGVRHARGSLLLTTPTVGRLQYRLDERAMFVSQAPRGTGLVRRSCPERLAKRLIDAAPELGFRPCSGIVAVPLFIDGEVIATPGWNRRTKAVLEVPRGLPAIPAAPTRDEAESALGMLLAPFAGYLSALSGEEWARLRAAIVAAALTAILRPSLPAAPAILIDANMAGAGKGKLARALAMLACGRLPSIVTEGQSPQELEKRLAAAILSGAPALLLDNLQRPLESSTLESGLTEGIATIRLFGSLTDVTAPCSALVLITANNAVLRSDMLRRTLPVRIVVPSATPERRRFDFDPYDVARERRGEIIAAALTIAKAWWAVRNTGEGRRIRQTTLGSFERWADLVAGATAWLTGINPISIIEARKREDSRLGDERRVIAALLERFGSSWWKARDAAAALDASVWSGAVHFKGPLPDAGAIGRWLRARRDAVFGDHQLVAQPDRDGVLEWRLVRLCGEEPSVHVADDDLRDFMM